MDDAHDDLLTVLGDLGHLQPPVQEQEKAWWPLTLLENSSPWGTRLAVAWASILSRSASLILSNRASDRTTLRSIFIRFS